MADARFFIEANSRQVEALRNEASTSLFFDSENFKHLVGVLRIRSDERFEIVIRDTWETFSVLFLEANKNDFSVTVGNPQELFVAEPESSVELIFGVSKGEKNETIIRQATELGVVVIRPCFFQRSIVKMDAKKRENRHKRYKSVACHAAMQSHRNRLPELHAPMEFEACVSNLASDLVYVLWEEESGLTLFEYAAKDIHDFKLEHGRQPSIALVVGPEGGITREEVALLTELGARTASLGSTILRVDTANVVAVSQILTSFQVIQAC